MRRRWRRLLIPLATLVLGISLGAGQAAAADGPYPPVPSDAELQQLANDAVAHFPSCGTTIPNGKAAALHVSCTEIKISKWHSEASDAEYNDNWVLVTFKMSTGVFPDGRTDSDYHILSAQITANAPLDLLTGGWPAGRQTNDWSSWIPTWLKPDWDLTTHHPYTPGPSASPELPLCDAAISLPGGLKAGDVLAPDASVTSLGGAPVQGSISMVWTINGVVANSVTWDGNPAAIVLQLSCQGHAQEFQATYNGTLTQGPGPSPGGSSAPEPSVAPEPSGPPEASEAPEPEPSGTPGPNDEDPANAQGQGARGRTPGLGGIGSVPGPSDPIEGLVGMVAPGLLGLLGGLLLGGAGSSGGGTGNNGGGPGSSGSTGSEGPTGPGGPGSGDPAPTGKESGGEGTKTGPGGTDSSSGGLTTQGAIDKLTTAMNQAVAANNKTVQEVINNAQADLLDANGQVIPEKYAAALKAIEAAGAGAGPVGALGLYDPNSSTDAALRAAHDSWLGKKVASGVGGVVSFATAAGRGITQIADALAHPQYFLGGLEAATQKVAPTESAALNSALTDGRYLDALGAGAMKYGKGYFAGYQAVGNVAVTMVTGMLPVDEIKTLLNPKASLADKFAAYQSAEVKVALLVAPFLGEARAAGAAVDAARATEAANAAAKAGRAVEAVNTGAKAGRAVEAAETAGSAVKAGGAAEATTTAGTVARTGAAEAGTVARTGAAEAGGAEATTGGQAARAGAAETGAAEAKAAEATAGAVGPAKPPPLTPERLSATLDAGKKVERLSANVLGDTAAPTSLREGARIVRQSPELQAAADDAIRADGGSGAARMGRQVGDLNSDANNLITARKMDLQNQAMNNAAKRIADLEAKLCQAAGEPVPSRIPTFEVTQGNRGYISGANTSTDLDRTFQLRHVSSEQANKILAEECGKLGGPGKPGFTPNDLATHAYVAKPGSLVDLSGDAPLSDQFVRGNLQEINSKFGYVPTYTAPNGTITVGAHVEAGLGTEALPMAQRFGPTAAPAGGDAASAAARAAASNADVATQISKIDSAVAANNVNDCAKAAARAIKAGGHFVGPEEAIMRAAAAKDPIEATRILRQAGIDSLSDLQARVRP